MESRRPDHSDQADDAKKTGSFEQVRPEGLLIRPVARICSDFPEKFGIPRQSGLVPSLISRVVFEPEYADPSAVKGLEDFSHIWLIWEFTEAKRKGKETETSEWSPTVRPPRLGGNERMGVFATRSPFRPNSLGLSCVELKKIEYDPQKGPVLVVAGADLMDQTPIYDIKPYVPCADCIRDTRGGFTDTVERKLLHVDFPEPLRGRLPHDRVEAAIGILEQDPRPAYQSDPHRIYGVFFAGADIRFRATRDTLTVVDVIPRHCNKEGTARRSSQTGLSGAI